MVENLNLKLTTKKTIIRKTLKVIEKYINKSFKHKLKYTFTGPNMNKNTTTKNKRIKTK